MKLAKLTTLLVAGYATSLGAAQAADLLQPSGFDPWKCKTVSRVRSDWSEYMRLRYSEPTIGAETTSTYDFVGPFQTIDQTFGNRCNKGRVQTARIYSNLRFFMTRKVVDANPDPQYPADAQISVDFKSFIDPVRSQLGGPTLWKIQFYNDAGDILLTLGLPTSPEPNCTLRQPIRKDYRFTIPAQHLTRWTLMHSFRVIPIAFDTYGRCER